MVKKFKIGDRVAVTDDNGNKIYNDVIITKFRWFRRDDLVESIFYKGVTIVDSDFCGYQTKYDAKHVWHHEELVTHYHEQRHTHKNGGDCKRG